jgi:hypothetical protein
MSNPIDWGNSPITVGLVRGVIAALLIALYFTLQGRAAGMEWEPALYDGAQWGIPVLLALLGYGLADQNRANHGIAIKGDVPVASEELKVTKTP